MFKLNQEQGKPDKTGLKPNQVWYPNAKSFLSTPKETISSAITMVIVTHILSLRVVFTHSLNLFANSGKTETGDFFCVQISQKKKKKRVIWVEDR